jgi:GINS complex subunit 3
MPRYLDLDQILAEEERLPCLFNHGAEHLNHLSGSDDADPNLPAGSRVELPLWLARKFYDQSFVNIELPKHFRQKMRNELVGSSGVNLREYSYYFFDVGLKLSETIDDVDLRRVLRRAFAGDRYRSLMAHSMSTYHDDVTEYCQTLTAPEMRIFNKGMAASKDLARWRAGNGSLLEMAPILNQKSTRRKSHVGNDQSDASKRAKFI